MASDASAFFGPMDYAIFAGMLIISLLIGVYFAFFAKQKQDSTHEYLMGGGTIGVFPIAMSLIASNISGIVLMGIPSEVYTYGTLISLTTITETAASLFGAYMILPVIYNLKITSLYEYLELRYNSTLRKLGSLLFLLANILYVPIVIYLPALAFSQISGMSLLVLIPLVCSICTFYTTLGGLKAVVWTDTFQTLMILLGVVAVAVIGTISVGGVAQVWSRNEASGRIELFNMNWDLTMRHTFWSIIIGRFFANLSIGSVNQSMAQRFIALPTIKKSRIAILLLSVGVVFISLFCCYTGLVIFAAFHDCDPLAVGYVRKPDGIVPYFVMKFTSNIPALPGVFMAGVFSAALSTMSTCQNSMCGVLFEDFIRPCLKKTVSEARCSFYMKVIAVVIGFITTALALLVDSLGGVIQTNASLKSITMSSLLGMYLLGMFVPWSNSTGTLVGVLVGSAAVGWISVGAQHAIANKQIVYPWKPFRVDGCDNVTTAAYLHNMNSTLFLNDQTRGEPFILYQLSYVYYTLVGVLVCMTVGIIVSWATGFQDISKLDGKLLNPYIRAYFNTRDKIEEQIHKNHREIQRLMVY